MFAKDKLLHFSGSVVLVILFSLFITNIHAAANAAIAIGIAKEVFDDHSPKHTSDVYDIVADAIGVTVGVLILYVLKANGINLTDFIK